MNPSAHPQRGQLAAGWILDHELDCFPRHTRTDVGRFPVALLAIETQRSCESFDQGSRRRIRVLHGLSEPDVGGDPRIEGGQRRGDRHPPWIAPQRDRDGSAHGVYACHDARRHELLAGLPLLVLPWPPRAQPELALRRPEDVSIGLFVGHHCPGVQGALDQLGQHAPGMRIPHLAGDVPAARREQGLIQRAVHQPLQSALVGGERIEPERLARQAIMSHAFCHGKSRPRQRTPQNDHNHHNVTRTIQHHILPFLLLCSARIRWSGEQVGVGATHVPSQRPARYPRSGTRQPYAIRASPDPALRDSRIHGHRVESTT